MFSAFHLFFGLGIAWLEALSFLPSPCSLLSCVRGPLGWESYHDTSLFLLYYYLSFISSLPVGLRANAPAEPVHFTHLYLFWALLVNIPIVLAHFISQASSAHLFLFYLFYFHGLFSKYSGFPWPNYHSFNSYYFSGLLAFKLTQWSHFLGFLYPFTSSLPFIVLMDLPLHSLDFLGPFTSSLPLLFLWAC